MIHYIMTFRNDSSVENDTLDIDMRSSWTNGIVTVGLINKIASGVPVLDDGCLFVTSDSKTFFQSGERVAPQPVSVAHFTPSGKGDSS